MGAVPIKCILTVMGYLYNQVGEGRIRRSDIVFSIDKDTRDTIEYFIHETGITYSPKIYQAIEKSGKQVHRKDLEIYLVLRDARVALGDMYEIIRHIEVTLHSSIKSILVSEYDPNRWWKQGVPGDIRVDCVSSRERDSEAADDPYGYTNFMHLKKILDKQWRIFSEVLPPDVSSDKKKLLSGLTKLNAIRNSVMHPVRASAPTHDDFLFVREFRNYLQLDNWLELLKNYKKV